MVIHNGVSLERFHPISRYFGGNIGILGNLIPRKRVYDLLLTFRELVLQRNDLHLHIGGGLWPAYEDYYFALQRLVDRLNLRDKVTFYGHIDNPMDWYHMIDIYISNSYSEGLQVSPIEAMASGCYCLIHNWEGADELVPDKYLFYTSNELMAKVLDYCKSSEAEKLEQRNIMRSIACDRFDLNKIKSRVMKVIENTDINNHG